MQEEADSHPHPSNPDNRDKDDDAADKDDSVKWRTEDDADNNTPTQTMDGNADDNDAAIDDNTDNNAATQMTMQQRHRQRR